MCILVQAQGSFQDINKLMISIFFHIIMRSYKWPLLVSPYYSIKTRGEVYNVVQGRKLKQNQINCGDQGCQFLTSSIADPIQLEI